MSTQHSSQLELPIELDTLRSLLRKHGVKKAAVFGSYARNEATADSDIDLLVSLEEGRSLWDLGGLQYELSEITHREVDITTKINPLFAPYVEPELVEVL